MDFLVAGEQIQSTQTEVMKGAESVEPPAAGGVRDKIKTIGG